MRRLFARKRRVDIQTEHRSAIREDVQARACGGTAKGEHGGHSEIGTGPKQARPRRGQDIGVIGATGGVCGLVLFLAAARWKQKVRYEVVMERGKPAAGNLSAA